MSFGVNGFLSGRKQWSENSEVRRIMATCILHATYRETHRVEEGMAVQIHGVVFNPHKSAVYKQVVVRVSPPIGALALKVEFTFHVTKPVWFGIETTAVGSVVDGWPSGLTFML